MPKKGGGGLPLPGELEKLEAHMATHTGLGRLDPEPRNEGTKEPNLNEPEEGLPVKVPSDGESEARDRRTASMIVAAVIAAAFFGWKYLDWILSWFQ